MGLDQRPRTAKTPGTALAVLDRPEPAEPALPEDGAPALGIPSLTAAISQVVMDGVAWKSWRFGDKAWQRDAWRLYDITGQLRFVANWVGNSVSRCRLYVAEVDESGEAAKETTDPQVAMLAAGPLGRGPAKDEALRLLGINLFVPGEAYIIAEAGAGENAAEDRWWVVSGRQIRRTGDQITVKRSQLHGGGVMEYRDGTDLILRCWTPHPADTDLADSPTRSAIPDLRELEALRKREFAELDSRLAGAGLLALPEGLDFPRGDKDPPGMPGFTALLMRAMSTSLQDRSSAEALVPIMFTAPPELIDKIKLITFWSDLSDQILPLREAAIKSLAQSLDVPAEVLLGMGDTNHWSAWQVSEDAVSTQIVPVCSRIAEALTVGYLRGALEKLGKDPEAYVYAFDTAPLTTRPNRSADALNFHDKLLLSDKATLAAGAFPEESLPTQEERLRRIAEKAIAAAPTLLADPILRELIGLPAGMGQTEPAPDDEDEDAPAQEPQEAEEDRSLPEETPQSEAAAVLTAAKMAVVRAMGLAGGRLVSHRQRDRWPGTARHQLHSCHGPVTRERAEEVLRGAWTDLEAVDLPVDVHALKGLLHGFCIELLSRGLAYDPALLRDLLAAAVKHGRVSRCG